MQKSQQELLGASVPLQQFLWWFGCLHASPRSPCMHSPPPWVDRTSLRTRPCQVPTKPKLHRSSNATMISIHGLGNFFTLSCAATHTAKYPRSEQAKALNKNSRKDVNTARLATYLVEQKPGDDVLRALRGKLAFSEKRSSMLEEEAAMDKLKAGWHPYLSISLMTSE